MSGNFFPDTTLLGKQVVDVWRLVEENGLLLRGGRRNDAREMTSSSPVEPILIVLLSRPAVARLLYHGGTQKKPWCLGERCPF